MTIHLMEDNWTEKLPPIAEIYMKRKGIDAFTGILVTIAIMHILVMFPITPIIAILHINSLLTISNTTWQFLAVINGVGFGILILCLFPIRGSKDMINFVTNQTMIEEIEK